MSSADHPLCYQKVLETHYGALLTGSIERDEWVHHQAQDMQALMVIDEVRRTMSRALSLSDGVYERDAVIPLKFGVARRMKFIWSALRRVYATAPPGRTMPISLDDVENIASDLNVIYLNIRGALDNFAWAIRALCKSDLTDRLKPLEIDLFGAAFRKAVNAQQFHSDCGPFANWYRAVKARRDPGVHRIPLSVPPTLLNAEALAEYNEWDQRRASVFEKINAILAKASSEDRSKSISVEISEEIALLHKEVKIINEKQALVGVFPGLFVHHPDEPSMPIFPTVAEDIGNFVSLAEIVSNFIANRAASLQAGVRT